MNRISIALALAGLVVSLSATAQDAPNLLWGSPAPVAQAQRTIVIAPDTGWVNVAQGEAIRFVETAELSQCAVFRRASQPAPPNQTPSYNRYRRLPEP